METKARISNISIDFESGKQVISLVCEKDIREDKWSISNHSVR